VISDHVCLCERDGCAICVVLFVTSGGVNIFKKKKKKKMYNYNIYIYVINVIYSC
jgi:predicted peroxiredoxin